ncbi:uncharacterized protein LOC128885600 [Hylaeus anthracinus]|uniref:uncharacterized protein LOC128885600 n=1 Tax=Hylaeus anthracinus TaxID=313031 RepID=UPI0023B99657|nr:uncharacterized protein LOC128885600 [Hylaeus anthracinus]
MAGRWEYLHATSLLIQCHIGVTLDGNIYEIPPMCAKTNPKKHRKNHQKTQNGGTLKENAVQSSGNSFKNSQAVQAPEVNVATVCDQGSTNCKAIQSLLNSSKRNAFQESNALRHDVIVIDNNMIVPLFDSPHLLKCVRNNLLTKDLRFKFQDNISRVAKWAHVEYLYFIDSSNVYEDRLLHKLTATHVVPSKIPKIKVKYCDQVFSRAVGALMTLMSRSKAKSVCGTREMSGDGIDTARLIHFMNSTFDSVNSSVAQSTSRTDMTLVNVWNVAISGFRSTSFLKR